MVGAQFHNGAVELMRKETNDDRYDIVLALWGHEFVVWEYQKPTDTLVRGDYFRDDLKGAMETFEKRI